MSRSKRKMPEGEFLATVTGLDHDGRGVARVDGKVTFIADALPGEEVRFAYTLQRREYDEGRLVEVLQASPHRVTPPCPHFGLCGGCALQHLAADQQIVFKQDELLQALRRIGGVVPESVAPALTGESLGYRRRARMGAKFVPKKGGMLVGFRERSSHFLAQLEQCKVLDPRVGQKLLALGEALNQLSVRDQIPQIEVAIGNHVCLVIRVMQPPTDHDKAVLAQYAAEHDVEIRLQPKGLDSIVPLTEPARVLAYSPDGGPETLQFRPADFIQVNGPLSQRMVQQSLDWLALQPGARVLELFAGLGNFTLPLAKTGAIVTAVEGDQGLVTRGRANTEHHGYDVDWHVADLFLDVADAPYLQGQYDAILLDPPRAGAETLTPVIAQMGVPRIVYVSCHPGTLARDAKALIAAGYRLEKAGVMDMFPHTAHVESMALFTRA